MPAHRGIYEAVKGIYEQMLPEVLAHLQAQVKRATFHFTEHFLRWSSSLLVNLMLLHVITFQCFKNRIRLIGLIGWTVNWQQNQYDSKVKTIFL